MFELHLELNESFVEMKLQSHLNIKFQKSIIVVCVNICESRGNLRVIIYQGLSIFSIELFPEMLKQQIKALITSFKPHSML